MNISLKGACDMHMHTAPDTGDRIGDDFEIARACRDAGLRAIVLKNEFESTASRAILARKVVPYIDIFGSICLNTPIGGINPAAVEIALKLGAKIIWFPTKYSKAHIDVKGSPGLKTKVAGETIFDEHGEITQACKDIINMAKEHDAVVGTAHLSTKEIFSVVKFSRDINFNKMVITHPHYIVPNLSDEVIKELVDLGAWVEFCAGTVFPVPGYGRVDNVVRVLNTIGPHRCIISSDAGRPTKPKPAETLSVYLYCLSVKGIKSEWLDCMVKDNPAKLLNL